MLIFDSVHQGIQKSKLFLPRELLYFYKNQNHINWKNKFPLNLLILEALWVLQKYFTVQVQPISHVVHSLIPEYEKKKNTETLILCNQVIILYNTWVHFPKRLFPLTHCKKSHKCQASNYFSWLLPNKDFQHFILSKTAWKYFYQVNHCNVTEYSKCA
jgi:hypothetical protein